MQTLIVSGLIFALFIGVFASQNTEPVSLKFITWQTETPLVVVVMIASMLGALIMGLPGWIKQFKKTYEIRYLKSKIVKLEKEKEELQDLFAASRTSRETDSYYFSEERKEHDNEVAD